MLATRSAVRRRCTKRQGMAALELVGVLPFLTALILGAWELGRLIEVHQLVANAATEGGRQASMGVYSNAQVRQVVLNALQLSGLNAQNATVTVTNVTNPGTDVSVATRLDAIRVSVSLPYRDVSWITAGLYTNSSTHVDRDSVWYSARNASYPTSITVPSGY